MVKIPKILWTYLLEAHQPHVSFLFTDQGPEKRAGERESVPNLPRVPRPQHQLAIDGTEGREEEQEERKKVRFQSNNQLEGRTSYHYSLPYLFQLLGAIFRKGLVHGTVVWSGTHKQWWAIRCQFECECETMLAHALA